MKNYFVAFVFVFSVLGTANSQELHGKKLSKKVTALMAADDVRGAIDLINPNKKGNGKYQADIMFQLAQLQFKAYLLDSAAISLEEVKSLKNKKLAEQVTTLQTELTKQKEQYNVEVALGYNHLQKGENDEAMKAFNNAITYDTGNYEVYLAFGEAEVKKGDYKASIVSFKEAETKYNTDVHEQVHVMEHLAKAYLAIRKAKEAIAVCDKAIEMEPTNQYLFFLKGKGVYYQRGFAFAISYFNQYLNSGAKSAEAHYYRGVCYYEIKKYSESVADFSSAIKLDSSNTEVIFQRGMSYYHLDNFTDAKSDFQTLLTQSKGNFIAENALGVCAYGEKNYPEAVSAFQNVVKASNTQYYQYNLAMAYYYNKQYDKALELFNQLGEINRNQVKYNIMHCKTLMAKNDYSTAKDWMEESVKNNPFVKEYAVLSGEIYGKLNMTLESKDMISRQNDLYGDPISFDLSF